MPDGAHDAKVPTTRGTIVFVAMLAPFVPRARWVRHGSAHIGATMRTHSFVETPETVLKASTA